MLRLFFISFDVFSISFIDCCCHEPATLITFSFRQLYFIFQNFLLPITSFFFSSAILLLIETWKIIFIFYDFLLRSSLFPSHLLISSLPSSVLRFPDDISLFAALIAPWLLHIFMVIAEAPEAFRRSVGDARGVWFAPFMSRVAFAPYVSRRFSPAEDAITKRWFAQVSRSARLIPTAYFSADARSPCRSASVDRAPAAEASAHGMRSVKLRVGHDAR